ncbi:MAG: cobyrinate a,c-diamide synthase, partial [Fusobacterium mortiferum]|nr:cobyrinate a,c-diamide synthase [Fusobacterium mortiferum]
IGYLPKDESLSVSSRHLGLLQAEEIDDLREKSKHLKGILQKTIDVERLLEIAELREREYRKNPFEELKDKYKGLKVGVAKDKAFSFYYNDNLELMEDLGMELIPFSPMSDKEIPEVDLLYFGGGYPENYAKELSSNIEMIESIREYHQKGGKIYGECGGFMYLTSRIKLLDGKYFPMCDIIKCSVEMRDRLDISRFGYISLYDKEKTLGRGHEFHYSKISDIKDDSREYRAIKPNGKEWACVFKEKNCRAGYPHIHFFKSLDYLYEIIKGNR